MKMNHKLLKLVSLLVVSHSEEEVALGDVATAEAEEEAMEALAAIIKDKLPKEITILMNSLKRWKTGASAWANGARRSQKSTSKEARTAVKVWILRP